MFSPNNSKKASKPKPRSKQRQPVSFQEFIKLIENLPSIAFKVQCDHAGNGDVDGVKKTLEKCAMWYYNAFYKDATVRERYPFRLCACPQQIKDRLLSMPEAEEDASPEEFEHESADGVTVEVGKMGKFNFPVSYYTFKKYVDKKKVRHFMKHKHKSPPADLPDATQKQNRWRRFYKNFYLFPKKRKSTNIFPKAPDALMPKLLECGQAMDESAVKSLAEHNKSSDSSIVSYEEFAVYLENLYSIACHLKLNDPEYAPMGFEDCAYAYYMAFYLTPEIRERYKYTLKACTSDMSARLLAIPSRKEAKKLRRTFPDLIKLSPDLKRPKSSDCITETDNDAPVAYLIFKKYIKNLNKITKQMRSCDEYKHLSKRQCTREYFRQFYSSPEIRERFQFKLKPCPEVVREKLLSRPTCSVIADSPNEPKELDEPQLIKPIITFEGVTPHMGWEYPIPPQCFCQYINYKDLIYQIRTSDQEKIRKDATNLTDEQLMQRFYHAFYTDEGFRVRYHYSFRAAPPELRVRLLQFAQRVRQSESEGASNGVEKAAEQNRTDPLEAAPVFLSKIREMLIRDVLRDHPRDAKMKRRTLWEAQTVTLI
ncbi:protein telomere ends associated-like [Drosophila obscura]|uniref:protein telomere ends associated-like n=1 Tax=Drosophila obscura TaxID=7282 RepID=UPI001BB2982F|nr:protein telomere ends associated-like [Drosophila obscura]